MAFNVQGALAAGYTQEQIDNYLATGQDVAQPSQPSAVSSPKTFNVQGALAAGYTQEQIDNYLATGQDVAQPGQAQQPQQSDQPKILKEGEGSDFFRGFGTYGDQMGGIYGGAKVLAGKAFGSDDLIKSGMESMQTSEAAIGRRGTKETDSFTRAIEKGVGGFITEYIPFIAGQGVGMIGEALITSIAGGFLGSAVGPGGTVSGGVGGIVGKNLVKKGIKEEANKILKEQGQEASEAFIAKKVTEELAKPEMRKLVNKRIGQTTALGAMAGKFGAGEVTGRAVDEAIVGVEDPEEQLEIIKGLSTSKLAALSSAHALADFFAIKIGLGSLDKLNATTTNALVAVMKNVGITGLKEAPIEAVQTVIERYGADLPLNDKEALEEYINAAAAGFFMPIVPATIGGIRSSGQKKLDAAKTEQDETDQDTNQDTELNEGMDQPSREEIQKQTLEDIEEQLKQEKIDEDARDPILNADLLTSLGLKKENSVWKRLLDAENNPRFDIATTEGRQAILAELKKTKVSSFNRQEAGKVAARIKRMEPKKEDWEIDAEKKAADAAPIILNEETLIDAGIPMGSRAAARKQLLDESGKPLFDIYDAGLPEETREGIVASLKEAKKLKGTNNKKIDALIKRVKNPVPKGEMELDFSANQTLRKNEKEIEDRAGVSLRDSQLGLDLTPSEELNADVETRKADQKINTTIEEAQLKANRNTNADRVAAQIVAEETARIKVEQDVVKLKATTKKPPAKKVQLKNSVEVIKELKPAPTVGNILNQLGQKKRFLPETQSTFIAALRKIPNIGKTKFEKSSTKLKNNRPGEYLTFSDTVKISDNANVETVLHEVTHAATSNRLRIEIKNGKGVTPLGKRVVELYNRAKKADLNNNFKKELKTVDEFVTEAFNNPSFQRFLASVKSTKDSKFARDQAKDTTTDRSLWNEFVEAVKEILNLDISNTVLNDVLAIAPELFTGPDVVAQKGKDRKAERLPQEGTLDETADEGAGGKPPRRPSKFTSPPGVAPDSDQDRASAVREVGLPMRFFNAVFSFDAGLNNRIRKAMEALGTSVKKINQVLADISSSQALHAINLARQFAIHGNIQWNPDTSTFIINKNNEEKTMDGVRVRIQEYADARGISYEEADADASFAFEAKRLQALKKYNMEIRNNAKDFLKKGEKDKAKNELKKLKIIHMTPEKIKEGEALFEAEGKTELEAIEAEWMGVREYTIKFLVDTETISKDKAEEWLDNRAYVPFQREGQNINDYNVGLKVTTDLFKPFKGSYRPVKNVFDNMDKWVQHSIRRGVLNKVKANKIRATLEYAPDIIREVNSKEGAKGTIVSASMIDPETGEIREFLYQFSDPVYASAFGGMQSVVAPGMKYWTAIANTLRQNVVLFPLFSISQLTQDSVSAMISSGVKNPFMIPYRVMKEFVSILRGTSKSFEYLERQGTTGGTAFNQATADEALSNVNSPAVIKAMQASVANSPMLSKIVRGLEKFAMASDNAVRIAVYDQIMLETATDKSSPESILATGDSRRAINSGFEVINFRRKGANEYVTALTQVVPFLGAGLQALSVQGRVLTGQGISPGDRVELLKQTYMNLGYLAGATLAYSALMSDDEDYQKLDPKSRDNLLVLPGGFSVPLRPDLFTLIGKIIPEHVFQQLAMESQDNQKIITALQRGLINSLAINANPQFLKPIGELYFNQTLGAESYPIVPQSLQELEASEQYRASTTQFARMIGTASTELKLGISPLKIDHFLRSYFGYTSGLALMIIDEALVQSGGLSYERPERSLREVLRAIPGTTRNIVPEFGNRDENDYYELNKEIAPIVKNYLFKDKNSYFGESAKYFDKNRKALEMKEVMSTYKSQLAAVRRQEQEILRMPKTIMDGATKKQRLDILKEEKQRILSDIGSFRKEYYN